MLTALGRLSAQAHAAYVAACAGGSDGDEGGGGAHAARCVVPCSRR
jgi:hypothetical protein